MMPDPTQGALTNEQVTEAVKQEAVQETSRALVSAWYRSPTTLVGIASAVSFLASLITYVQAIPEVPKSWALPMAIGAGVLSILQTHLAKWVGARAAATVAVASPPAALVIDEGAKEGVG